MSARNRLFAGFLLSIVGTTNLFADDIPDIVRKAKPAVVQVVALDANGNVATGSGFFITPDGLLLTNYHIIKNARSIGARTPSGAYYPFSGEWAQLSDLDIAMLKFEATDVSYLLLESNIQVEEGQRVLVIGNPEGLQGTVSDGLVAAIRDNGKYIQITAPISHGSSGSPVLNDQGKVVGIATSMLVSGQNLNFAISSRAAKLALDKWMASIQSAKGIPERTPQPTTNLRDFVERFVTSGNNDDRGAEISYYADQVDYFDNGAVTKAFIAEDINKYNTRWPQRRYWVDAEPEIEIVDSAHDVARATIIIGFAVQNRQQAISGTCQDVMLIRDANTNPRVTYVRSKLLSRHETANVR